MIGTFLIISLAFPMIGKLEFFSRNNYNLFIQSFVRYCKLKCKFGFFLFLGIALRFNY